MRARRSLIIPSLLVLGAAAALGVSAAAQEEPGAPEHDVAPRPMPDFPLEPPQIDPRAFDDFGPDIEIREDEPEPEPEPEPQLTREERFDALFAELAGISDDAEAAFVAEEIEALWRDSGSPTVDLLTDRATDALMLGDVDLARELIDGALELGPDHAEAWAQSAEIAMAEEEFGLALEHIEQAVIYEPRHYHALTELGIILERLGSAVGAYDAYTRALELNPRLPAAVAGAERTEREARGREL